MKIGIVSATYPPYLGGTGNVCAAHANELVELGHEVHVFTAGSSPTVHGNPTVYSLRSLLKVGNASVLPQLLWRLRGYDVVHWHYPFFGGEFTALGAKLSGTPLVVTYHQDVILDGLLGRVADFLEKTVSKWALLSADKILFTSADYAAHSKFRTYIPAEKIGVLSNGVDINRFSPSAQKQNAPFTALLVAGLDAAHYFKGVSNFLQAIAQSADTHAIIVGDGALRAKYESEANALGIRNRVQFAGRVSDEALPSYYQSAEVTVLPSTTMGEAFGLVLVESLACCTPIIASDLPGVRTVVSEGEDGYLVEPNNVGELAQTLEKMRQLPFEVRKQMGVTGCKKVAETYHWTTIGEKLEQLYQHVAA